MSKRIVLFLGVFGYLLFYVSSTFLEQFDNIDVGKTTSQRYLESVTDGDGSWTFNDAHRD